MIDTNVLVYIEDGDERSKQSRAREVLRHLTKSRSGVLSSQVLGEFFVTLRRRFASSVDVPAARHRVAELRRVTHVVDTDTDVVMLAIDGVRRYGMHFYDAEIWAAAKVAGARWLLSEDFSAGSEVDGVTFVNPFAEDFDVEAFIALVEAD